MEINERWRSPRRLDGKSDGGCFHQDDRAQQTTKTETLNQLDEKLPDVSELKPYLVILDNYCRELGDSAKHRAQLAAGRYPPVIEQFMDILARHWCTSKYDPELHGAMLRDNNVVSTASLDDLRSMLTFCVRSERFGEGNFGAHIMDGRIQAVLRRLEQVCST